MTTKDGPIEFTPIVFKPEDLIGFKDDRLAVDQICREFQVPKAVLDIVYDHMRQESYCEAIFRRMGRMRVGKTAVLQDLVDSLNKTTSR